MVERFAALYGTQEAVQRKRYQEIAERFAASFGEGRALSFFSAPGRTEIGGNHTDHNHGRVLAAAVNLDIVAAAAKNNDNVIRLKSLEYEKMDEIDLSSLSVQEQEKEGSAALLRGICHRCKSLGYQIGGFDAYTISEVLKGSGLSSSAAFEVLVVTVISHLYNDGAIAPVTAAQISQYAENVYFGKPSGLMDQMASSVGGFIGIDFQNPEKPVVEQVLFSLEESGYALCIVDTGGSHADLTGDYAAIPAEMKSVAKEFGCEVLRDVDETLFLARIAKLREKVGDRAVLRALHFFEENRRVQQEVSSLQEKNMEAFLAGVLSSGHSSSVLLQNVFSLQNPAEQGSGLALALSEKILEGRGAWRIHGGGFAGTIQAFVPFELLEAYRTELERVFGKGTCHVLSVRNAGGVRVLL